MARVIPIAPARGFWGVARAPTQKPPAEAGGMPRPITHDAVARVAPTKSPRRKPVGCRAPSPTTPSHARPKSPRRKPVGMPRSITHDAVARTPPKSPRRKPVGCRAPSRSTPSHPLGRSWHSSTYVTTSTTAGVS